MTYQGFEFYCASQKLFGQYWTPDHVTGIVLLVHGLGEHSGRYSSFVVPELVNAGYAVLSFDLFGHGHSEGERGTNPGYETLLDAMFLMEEKAFALFGNLPLFYFGHSLGGHLVLAYAMRRSTRAGGLVVCSPFLKMAFDPPAWKLFAGKVLWKLAPRITMSSGLNTEHISRDPNEVAKYKEDPLIHDRVSGNYIFPVLQWGTWIVENGNNLKIPLYLAHGTGDQITSHWATKALAKNATGSTLRLFDGAYHELHNELDKKEHLSGILDWLKEQLKNNDSTI